MTTVQRICDKFDQYYCYPEPRCLDGIAEILDDHDAAQQATIARLEKENQRMRLEANAASDSRTYRQQSGEQRATIARLEAKIASITAYVVDQIPECDPYCCAELLQEIKDIIEQKEEQCAP